MIYKKSGSKKNNGSDYYIVKIDNTNFSYSIDKYTEPHALKLAHMSEYHEIKFQNYFEIQDGIIFVYIYSKIHGMVVTMVDEEYIELVINYKFFLNGRDGSPYVKIKYSKTGNNAISLHRLIMNFGNKNMEVDHIDRNTLNNLKSNLRLVSQKDNVRNKSKYINNKTGVKGVYFQKDSNCYCATWRDENGNKCSKKYSIRKYGKDEAFNKACNIRQEMENKYYLIT